MTTMTANTAAGTPRAPEADVLNEARRQFDEGAPNRNLLRALVDRVEQAEAAREARREELLADVIAKAQRIATDSGWCDSFDEIMGRLDLPGRTRSWTVSVGGTWRAEVSVDATSAADARSRVEEFTGDQLAQKLGVCDLGPGRVTFSADEAWLD